MAVTQKEIAEQLGISRTLVTMALQGNQRVGSETRERVQAAARELGYTQHSNQAARALIGRRYGKRPRTGIIAVFTPRGIFAGTPVPGVPFFEPFIRGIETAALERNMDVFLCTLHTQRLPRMVAEGNVDGIICLGSGVPEFEALGVPCVVFNNVCATACSLTPDSARGMELAVAHLASLGHCKIGYIGFKPEADYLPSQQRLAGFKSGLKRVGLELQPELIEATLANPTVAAGEEGMTRLLARTRDFTAVVCFNDLIAMGAIDKLKAAKIKVPRAVSVVGFDDVGERYRFRPALTSIFFDRYLMGCRAVEIIDGAVGADNDEIWRGREERFAVALRVRASTGAVMA